MLNRQRQQLQVCVYNTRAVKVVSVMQQSVNEVSSMSVQVGRLKMFWSKEKLRQAGGCGEFVVIPNTELKVSWCLLETAENQRADRAQYKGTRDKLHLKGVE